MLVLALASEPLFLRLRFSLGPKHRLRRADAERLELRQPRALAQLRAAHVVVVEPLAAVTARRGTGAGHVPWPADTTVLYTSLLPGAMRATLEMLARAHHPVVLAGTEDAPDALRSRLESIGASRLASTLLATLAPPLDLLPPLLRHALREALRFPTRYESVDALSRDTGLSRRSVDRWFERVGLRSARRLLEAARVLHAVCYLRETQMPLATVARRTGQSSERLLRTQLRAVLRMTASEVRAAPDVAAMLAAISRHAHGGTSGAQRVG